MSRESFVGVACLEEVPGVKKILACEQNAIAAPLMGGGQGLLLLPTRGCLTEQGD